MCVSLVIEVKGSFMNMAAENIRTEANKTVVIVVHLMDR